VARIGRAEAIKAILEAAKVEIVGQQSRLEKEEQ
jgi:hypothetical protein